MKLEPLLKPSLASLHTSRCRSMLQLGGFCTPTALSAPPLHSLFLEQKANPSHILRQRGLTTLLLLKLLITRLFPSSFSSVFIRKTVLSLSGILAIKTKNFLKITLLYTDTEPALHSGKEPSGLDVLSLLLCILSRYVNGRNIQSLCPHT